MNTSRATFRAIIVALFLLLSQAAVVAHALDHDSTEHAEWCQLLNKSDVSFAVSSAPELTEQCAPFALLVDTRSLPVGTSAHLNFSSRAPPAI